MEALLLQDFPLFRVSDSECNEEDEAPDDEKHVPFSIHAHLWDLLERGGGGYLSKNQIHTSQIPGDPCCRIKNSLHVPGDNSKPVHFYAPNLKACNSFKLNSNFMKFGTHIDLSTP